VNGIYIPVRGSKDKPCLLVAMGTVAGGEKRLLGIEEASGEISECRERVLRGLRLRGMNPPHLEIAGSAPARGTGQGVPRDTPAAVLDPQRAQRPQLHEPEHRRCREQGPARHLHVRALRSLLVPIAQPAKSTGRRSGHRRLASLRRTGLSFFALHGSSFFCIGWRLVHPS